MRPAERASNRFFGTTADNSRPSQSALPGVIESTPAIHFGNSARSPLAGRSRQCLSANTTRSTPTTILITEAASDDPPESCGGNRSTSNVKSATAGPANRDRDCEGKELADRGAHAYQLLSDDRGSQPAATGFGPMAQAPKDGPSPPIVG